MVNNSTERFAYEMGKYCDRIDCFEKWRIL
jgi:hypothetical protein